VTAILLGTAETVPELWPADVAEGPYLDKAVLLARAVAAAARPLHRLNTTNPLTSVPKPAAETPPAGSLDPRAVVRTEALLPDNNSVEVVAEAAEEFWATAHGFAFTPNVSGDQALHEALNFGAAHSNLHAVMATYDRPGSEDIAVFTARMLLEEAARHYWRTNTTSTVEYEARATRYFDEYRARAKKTVDLLAGNGVPRKDALRIMDLPNNANVVGHTTSVTKGRVPTPTIASMLRDLGTDFPEPGWFEVAYSFLSQTTHATPLGYLHSVRFTDGTWQANAMSPEMLGLALDVACLSSARLISHSVLVFSNLTQDSKDYRIALFRAAMKVHSSARLLHGLD